jgi:hypothetical protein
VVQNSKKMVPNGFTTNMAIIKMLNKKASEYENKAIKKTTNGKADETKNSYSLNQKIDKSLVST